MALACSLPSFSCPLSISQCYSTGTQQKAISKTLTVSYNRYVCPQLNMDVHLYFNLERVNLLALTMCISIFLYNVGVYKPRVRCYETSELCMKFERCLDSESKYYTVICQQSLPILVPLFQCSFSSYVLSVIYGYNWLSMQVKFQVKIMQMKSSRLCVPLSLPREYVS